MCEICTKNKSRFETFLGWICKPCYKRKKKEAIIKKTRKLENL